jgi:hypothetical protein
MTLMTCKLVAAAARVIVCMVGKGRNYKEMNMQGSVLNYHIENKYCVDLMRLACNAARPSVHEYFKLEDEAGGSIDMSLLDDDSR